MPLFRSLAALRLKPWEIAILGVASILLVLSALLLVGDFSIRLALWPSPGEGRYSQPIGRVTVAVNNTVRQAHGASEFVALRQNDQVYAFDTLMAGPGSSLKIALKDGGEIELAENSLVRLNFESRLQFSGLNRQPVVEVVAGTVAGQGTKTSALTLRSSGKTFQAGAQAVRVSRKDAEATPTTTAAAKPIVADAEKTSPKAPSPRPPEPSMEELTKRYAKLGAKVSSNASVSLADLGRQARRDGAVGGGKLEESLAGGGGGAKSGRSERQEEQQLQTERMKVAAQAKPAEEMLLTSGKQLKVKIEMANATEIEPKDNYITEEEKAGAFPVKFSWQAQPANAAYRVRFQQVGKAEEIRDIKADGDEVEFSHAFKQPGTYRWLIEDFNGAILTVRNLHVKTKVYSITLSEPALIGRERGSKMWAASEYWAFLFKWKPVKGVATYHIRITRNADGAGARIAEKDVVGSEFLLPFRKNWEAEKMFFSVQARHPSGHALYSKTIPFMFTFLPPKPRVPKNGKVLARNDLTEGAVPLNWEANSDAPKFTVQVATDEQFNHVIDTDQSDSNGYRFYPGHSGRFFWRVRGDKESLSSPFSEVWEFTVK